MTCCACAWCQDGLVRVLDINAEKLLFSFRSQYGGMLWYTFAFVYAMLYIRFRVCYAMHTLSCMLFYAYAFVYAMHALSSAMLYMLVRVCVHVFVHVLYVLYVFACLCEYFITYIHSHIHTYIDNIDIEIETKKIKEIHR